MALFWKKTLGGALLCVVLIQSVYASGKDVTLVLLRHGESTFNVDKRFSGWSDIKLTDKGLLQAQQAGEAMKKEGLQFDEVHTSMLQRAIKTAWTSMESMEEMTTPQQTFWRLNERHYGDLEGKKHSDLKAQVGEEQVEKWRKDADTPPPPMSAQDPRSPARDPHYRTIDPRILPTGESLNNTVERIAPYWNDTLRPALANGKNVLVVAHSNSLKALSAWIDPSVKRSQISKLDVPNSTPIVYRLKVDGNHIRIISRKQLDIPANAKTDKH